MIRYAKSLILILLFAAQTNAWASYDSGLAAYRSGNYMLALKDLTTAADSGSAEAEQLLGHMYYMGTGVAQDFGKALEWHKKAASKGETESQFVIGTMYYSGKGVAQDYRTAMQWLLKAGDHGHVDAQYILGAMYFTGQGTPQDYQRSVIWLRRAAEHGHADAQRYLGMMHLYGIGGVQKDNVIAYMLWNLSAASGNADALDLRNTLGKQLSPRQIEEAQLLSSKWQQNTPLPTQSASGE